MKRHPVIDGFLSEIDPRLRRLPEARRAAERIGVDLAKAGGKTAEYALFFAWYSTFIVGAYLALFWSIGDPLPRHLPWVIVASAVLLPSAFICADVRKRRRATAK